MCMAVQHYHLKLNLYVHTCGNITVYIYVQQYFVDQVFGSILVESSLNSLSAVSVGAAILPSVE